MNQVARIFTQLTLVSSLAVLGTATASPGPGNPPLAAKIPEIFDNHGDRRVDDYFWIRDIERPEVMELLKAENRYADEQTAPSNGLRETLFKEIISRIEENDESVPVLENGYLYYSRTFEGKQYPIHLRRKNSPKAAEEVLLDGNELAKQPEYADHLSIGEMDVSPDTRILAYSTDSKGDRVETLFFKDLASGRLLPDRLERVTSFAWMSDSQSAIYTVMDEAKRSYRAYRHVLGTDPATDQLLVEEKDETRSLAVARSKTGRFVYLASVSLESEEWSWVDAGILAVSDQLVEFKVLIPRKDGLKYSVSDAGDRFLAVINDSGPDYRLAATSIAAPAQDSSRWATLIAETPGVRIESLSVFESSYVLTERVGGIKRFRVLNPSTLESRLIPFDEPVYDVSVGSNPEYGASRFRFVYESLTTPSSVYEHDLATGETRLLKRAAVKGGYDPSAYVTKRVYATAKDGTKVPVSLVYKKSLRRSGPQPLYLTGYGAYGIPYDVYFSHSRLSLIDRGVIFAIAHVRGGSDLGESWYLDGKLRKKMNTFTDFIAVTEHLIAEGYTSSDRLVAEGGSAGGLLMGAIANMRPDLYKLIVAHVPFVDMMNTMLDPTLPLTTGDYVEWGNPTESAEDYAYMKSYSPYDNVKAQDYPAIYMTTSINDSQVAYWEPVKWAAKLRATKTDDNAVIVRINMTSGHAGASGRYDAYKERAQTQAHVLWSLGIRN